MRSGESDFFECGLLVRLVFLHPSFHVPAIDACCWTVHSTHVMSASDNRHVFQLQVQLPDSALPRIYWRVNAVAFGMEPQRVAKEAASTRKPNP